MVYNIKACVEILRAMAEVYRTVYRQGNSEYEEKKSRFLSEVRHVESEEEALLVLSEIRKKHYDARHHCYAYILGKKSELKKSSDDGEPSGTAGHPMLAVLEGEGLTDTIIVVTRYFGGTLLGTGGLVRSYTKSAKDGVEKAVIADWRMADLLKIRSDYTLFGKIRYLAESENLVPGEITYTDMVDMVLPVPEERTAEIRKKITELTAGRAVITDEKKQYFAEIEGQTVYLQEEA